MQFAGIFLTSDQPEETARFYREVVGLVLEAVDTGSYTYWRADLDDVQLAIHDAAAFADYASPPERNSNVTHLYFRVADQNAFVAELAGRGIAPLLVDEVNVVVTDPDGRKVLFGTA